MSCVPIMDTISFTGYDWESVNPILKSTTQKVYHSHMQLLSWLQKQQIVEKMKNQFIHISDQIHELDERIVQQSSELTDFEIEMRQEGEQNQNQFKNLIQNDEENFKKLTIPNILSTFQSDKEFNSKILQDFINKNKDPNYEQIPHQAINLKNLLIIIKEFNKETDIYDKLEKMQNNMQQMEKKINQNNENALSIFDSHNVRFTVIDNKLQYTIKEFQRQLDGLSGSRLDEINGELQKQQIEIQQIKIIAEKNQKMESEFDDKIQRNLLQIMNVKEKQQQQKYDFDDQIKNINIDTEQLLSGQKQLMNDKPQKMQEHTAQMEENQNKQNEYINMQIQQCQIQIDQLCEKSTLQLEKKINFHINSIQDIKNEIQQENTKLTNSFTDIFQRIVRCQREIDNNFFEIGEIASFKNKEFKNKFSVYFNQSANSLNNRFEFIEQAMNQLINIFQKFSKENRKNEASLFLNSQKINNNSYDYPNLGQSYNDRSQTPPNDKEYQKSSTAFTRPRFPQRRPLNKEENKILQTRKTAANFIDFNQREKYIASIHNNAKLNEIHDRKNQNMSAQVQEIKTTSIKQKRHQRNNSVNDSSFRERKIFKILDNEQNSYQQNENNQNKISEQLDKSLEQIKQFFGKKNIASEFDDQVIKKYI